MTEYEFRFVVEGVTVHDTHTVDLLARELEAMLYRGGGVDLLNVAAEGDDAFAAAMSVGRRLADLAPQLRLLRLDRDLVGVPEIAERVGVSRQNVHQWIKGERRARPPFPKPEGTAGRLQVWLWTEVNDWLKRWGQDDGEKRPDRGEMADIDAALHHGLERKSQPTMWRWLRLLKTGLVDIDARPAAAVSLASEVSDSSSGLVPEVLHPDSEVSITGSPSRLSTQLDSASSSIAGGHA